GAHGGVRVDVVVVAHLLAAELLGAGEAGRGLVGDGQAGALVRVLAVAERGGDAELGGVGVGQVEDAELRAVVLGLGVPGGCGPGLLGVLELGEHPVADRVVVLGGAGEGDGRELLALGEGEAPGGRGLRRDRVALRVDDHGDGGEVLRGRTHHGGAAHVDLLDDLVEAAARGDGLAEGVEVDHDQVEGGDLVRLQLLPVVGEALVGEDAAVDARVEGRDPAVEHLGGSGDGRDVGDRDAGVPDGAAGGAGGDDLHAVRGEGAGQLDDAGLVVDGDQGSGQGATLCGAHVGCSCSDLLSVGTQAVDVHARHSLVVPHLRQSCGATVSGARRRGASQRAAVRRRTTSTRSGCSTALIRSWRVASVSSSRTSTAAWARMRPVSTPASTSMTLQPVIFTPWARASRTPCAPGNEGSRAGWVLTMRPPNSSSSGAPTSFMKPASTTSCGS